MLAHAQKQSARESESDENLTKLSVSMRERASGQQTEWAREREREEEPVATVSSAPSDKLTKFGLLVAF